MSTTTTRPSGAIFNSAADDAVAHVASRLVRRARLSATSHTTIHEETHLKRLTYTVTETAAILGISRTGAYECVRRGEIASLTLGRRVLIAHTALTKLLGEHADNDAIEPR